MSHPAQIVTDAIAAIESQQWAGFIALCDPVSVRRFKSDLVAVFSADKGYRSPVTVEDILEVSPEMPRAVAEYQLAEMERYHDPVVRMQLDIPAIASIEELDRLEPEQVLLRWLQSRMPHHTDGFTITSSTPVEGLDVVQLVRDPEAGFGAEGPPLPECTVLGSVRDGPDFTQVVCRQRYSFEDPDDELEISDDPADEAALDRALRCRRMMHTVTCRRQADRSWRLVAERNLFFLAWLSVSSDEAEAD